MAYNLKIKKLLEIPKGYKKTKGATTAPTNCDWYDNGKSRFGKHNKRKSVLVKRKGYDTNSLI